MSSENVSSTNGSSKTVTTDSTSAPNRAGSPLEVLGIFTKLGCTSFGGPVAHLGYFRDEFVDKRRWYSDEEYADLVALCQFMPGPASSQVGMAIGFKRAGYLGMAAAWLGFTLPSVILLVAFALGVAHLGDISGAGWLLGLKAAAVAVVAQAVLGMSKSIVTGKIHAGIALVAFLIVLLVPHPATQVGAIAVGMVAGAALLRERAAGGGDAGGGDGQAEAQAGPGAADAPAGAGAGKLGRSIGVAALAVFGILLAGLPALAAAMGNTSLTIFDSFYRSGALVFGGGHVVLPLLEQATVPTGMVDHDTFLAGYGAAQAVPGPLFTFASFLGAAADGVPWWWGAIVATLAIFLPAALLVIGVLPFWERLRAHPQAGAVLAGANAAVVGILAAALYNPVFTAGITGPATLGVAAAAFVALHMWKVPPWAVVILAALVGFAFL
ncbi:chromate efflux transporter [Corynebacterium aquatimens]|uniref:Chromate transporter n=1 Tax=Corynebacterium aquatimens TaxID=1190508 RepID=A0A931GVL5_9CORY|nr:chromate efflux transporter [Corynebacterium aquatimens]MBG6121396.1 chromate transporter [Corynebacterium aquatimens]